MCFFEELSLQTVLNRITTNLKLNEFCCFLLFFVVKVPFGFNLLVRLQKYRPTYLPPSLLPIYLTPYLPTYLPTYLPAYLPTYLPTYRPTYLHTYIHAYIHTCLVVCLLVFLLYSLPFFMIPLYFLEKILASFLSFF